MHSREFGETESNVELAAGSPGWERARASLAEIQRLASENQAHSMAVIWPMLVGLNGEYPYRAKHRLVAGECQRLGIPVFDLLQVFQGRDSSTLWASRDDHHPNAMAPSMAAKAVSRELTARRFAPGSERSHPRP